MKLQSTVEKISEAISKVQKISSKNVSLPVLENVLLIAQKNELILRATNLHVGVEVSIPVKTEQEGVVAVNLQLFSNIITSIRSGQNIKLEHKDQTLAITTSDSQMEVKTYLADDFPTLPHPTGDNYFSIPVESFVDGVRSVMYSASQSDIKPEIASVYIYSEKDNLIFVATDSFRLAEKKIKIKGIEGFPGVIVPIKNIQECIKIFAGDTGDIKLYLEDTQLSIVAPHTYVTSRVVDGTYPNYRQIIPTEFSTEAVLLKDDLVQTLRLVNVFSNSFNQVSLSTNEHEGKVVIASRNTDVGENSSSIDAAIRGEDQQMYVNHRYISDTFSSIQTDSISFSLVGKNKPFVVRGVGNQEFLYLIMPMNR